MRRTPLDSLRLAVHCLPRHTREAMLVGVRANDIVVGAYTDRDGRVCPMLAAHRNGGRTDHISFARAWDAFCRAKGPRPATPRETRILEGLLEASLMSDDDVELGGAIESHQELARERRAREAARTGGWGFLRARRPDARTESPERCSSETSPAVL